MEEYPFKKQIYTNRKYKYTNSLIKHKKKDNIDLEMGFHNPNSKSKLETIYEYDNQSYCCIL